MKNTEFLGPTKSKILNFLLERKRTAKELATILHIQVSAARKHLETMLEWDIVGEQFEHEGYGRPKKFYFLKEDGRELFPRKYDVVLNSVLANISSTKEKKAADRIVRQVAGDVVKELHLSGDCSKKHIELLTNGLNEFGFDSTFKIKENGYEILSRNCPLHKTALAYPKMVCHGLHGEIIKKATHAKAVNLTACVMSGDSACKHSIEI
jgi:predicted ArsR family transcriptional regulator